jgi:hypothetical protein
MYKKWATVLIILFLGRILQHENILLTVNALGQNHCSLEPVNSHNTDILFSAYTAIHMYPTETSTQFVYTLSHYLFINDSILLGYMGLQISLKRCILYVILSISLVCRTLVIFPD